MASPRTKTEIFYPGDIVEGRGVYSDTVIRGRFSGRFMTLEGAQPRSAAKIGWGGNLGKWVLCPITLIERGKPGDENNIPW